MAIDLLGGGKHKPGLVVITLALVIGCLCGAIGIALIWLT
jgi:hypothetical protein